MDVLEDDTHLANPGAQQADAHLPIIVQVGVEAPAALGKVVEERGNRRVDVGQLDVKQEESVLVRRARRAFDQRREQVLVHTEQEALEAAGTGTLGSREARAPTIRSSKVFTMMPSGSDVASRAISFLTVLKNFFGSAGWNSIF